MRLRPATMSDAQFLLDLKNDPVMRKFAVVSHEEIPIESHLTWLQANLETISIVLEDDGRDEVRLGMFRVSKDKEVSINLAPEARGKGLGSRVLKQCPKGVWAKIVNGNVPSMRIFLANGFKIVDYKEPYYVLNN